MKNINRAVVLIIALGISLLFLLMIKGFFDAVLLAAIFAGILFKTKRYFLEKTGKNGTSTLITFLLFLMSIIIPTIILSMVILRQGTAITEGAGTHISELINHPESLYASLQDISFLEDLLPAQDELKDKIEGLTMKLGNYFIGHLDDISAGTANYLLELFVLLYSLYYFLLNGDQYLKRLLYILPLKSEDEEQLFSKFTKVTKATLVGTLLIGFIQGGVGWLALLILGVPNSLFWGLIMIIASIIPAVGPALVWIPASVYLMLTNQIGSGVFLIVFGLIFIGNIDNFLRPRLVGKDAGLPDLMILLSTLGGLALFGISGLITGPIVAALFITIWDIYAKTFREFLHPVNEAFLQKEIDPTDSDQ